MEEKQGVSRLEQVVEEIFEEEKVKEVRREQKRQKRRARRKEKCKYGELSGIADTRPDEACTREPKENEEVSNCSLKNGNEVVTKDGESEPCHDEDDAKHCDEPSPENGHCSCDVMENGKGSEDSGSEGHRECGGKYRKHVRDTCASSSCRQIKTRGCNGFCGQVGDELFVDGEKHDEFPVDDEEKQLLLSMGWISGEPCQVGSILNFKYSCQVWEYSKRFYSEAGNGGFLFV